MTKAFTGVILAGGTNSRLPGRKKGFYEIGGRSIMDRIHGIFADIFDETIIVTNDIADFTGYDCMIASDIDPSRCALAGLYTGIFHASFDRVFVMACDTPFMKPEVIEYILEQADSSHDVVVPEAEGGLEALAALYTKNCLPLIQKNLANKKYMIKKFYVKNRTKVIPKEKIRKIDPAMRSFFNVNTPEDLEKAYEMVGSNYMNIKDAESMQ